jgi:hypothetical protein
MVGPDLGDGGVPRGAAGRGQFGSLVDVRQDAAPKSRT